MCAKQESGVQKMGWEPKGDKASTRQGGETNVELDTIKELGDL